MSAHKKSDLALDGRVIGWVEEYPTRRWSIVTTDEWVMIEESDRVVYETTRSDSVLVAVLPSGDAVRISAWEVIASARQSAWPEILHLD